MHAPTLKLQAAMSAEERINRLGANDSAYERERILEEEAESFDVSFTEVLEAWKRL